MARKRKLLDKLLSGSKNIRFGDFVTLIEACGFRLQRVQGSHHIYRHPLLPRPFPIQEVKGQAKPYQVRQFLDLMEKYNLHLADDEGTED